MEVDPLRRVEAVERLEVEGFLLALRDRRAGGGTEQTGGGEGEGAQGRGARESHRSRSPLSGE